MLFLVACGPRWAGVCRGIPAARRDVEEQNGRACRLLASCADAGVAFIVNDSMNFAKRLGADGVHLGQSDGDVREARALLGPSAQIGKTCHDSRHFAMEAGEAGADYVAFGAFYPTTTKPSNYRPDPSILTWWSTLFEIPCVAIGGITPDNAKPLVEAGADFLAVCQAVWERMTRAAVQAFAEALPWSDEVPFAVPFVTIYLTPSSARLEGSRGWDCHPPPALFQMRMPKSLDPHAEQLEPVAPPFVGSLVKIICVQVRCPPCVVLAQ